MKRLNWWGLLLIAVGIWAYLGVEGIVPLNGALVGPIAIVALGLAILFRPSSV
ncbi:MAG: hypothetical protein ACYDCK_13525 [Thermoplasmatota archaeon]